MPPERTTRSNDRLVLALFFAVLALLAWSAIKPHDYPTWALEVFPAVAGVVVLAATRKRFPLTSLAYCLAAIHCAILIVGGHYTYAEVPAGLWARDALGLSRNHYDRLGHFAQGFVPAIIAREVLLRKTPLTREGWGGWLFFLVVSVCLAIGAVYELVEWAVAEVDHAGSQAFLGTQGDVWDTQKDMALCGIGAVAALLTLGRVHDGQLKAMGEGARGKA